MKFVADGSQRLVVIADAALAAMIEQTLEDLIVDLCGDLGGELSSQLRAASQMSYYQAVSATAKANWDWKSSLTENSA